MAIEQEPKMEIYKTICQPWMEKIDFNLRQLNEKTFNGLGQKVEAIEKNNQSQHEEIKGQLVEVCKQMNGVKTHINKMTWRILVAIIVLLLGSIVRMVLG